MQHTIFGLISLYIAAPILWILYEVKEAKDLGLLSGWFEYFD